jgi:hypothetical protein
MVIDQECPARRGSVLEEALLLAWKVLEDDSTAMPAAIEEKVSPVPTRSRLLALNSWGGSQHGAAAHMQVHEALCAVYAERATADRQLY